MRLKWYIFPVSLYKYLSPSSIFFLNTLINGYGSSCSKVFLLLLWNYHFSCALILHSFIWIWNFSQVLLSGSCFFLRLSHSLAFARFNISFPVIRLSDLIQYLLIFLYFPFWVIAGSSWLWFQIPNVKPQILASESVNFLTNALQICCCNEEDVHIWQLWSWLKVIDQINALFPFLKKF